MNRRQFLRLTPALAAAAHAAPARRRPNIVLMMADDMGWSDLGCYGSEIATPNLDRLAAGGLRFTQFYNTARCCPTRASLLTGLYPHQAGVGHMVADYGVPGYRGDLNRSCVTLAEVLGGSGYQTAMCGKWHVTPRTADKHNWPLQRGFRQFFGTIDGAGSYYNPSMLVRDNTPIEPETKDFYYTDALGENAGRYIDGFAAKPETPFFLYLAFTAPHWPLHCPEETVRKYAETYSIGWDELRRRRLARQRELGLLPPGAELSPRDAQVPAWSEAPEKEWEARRMAVYAAMVDRMDQAVGKVVARLAAHKMLDNTLILFLADNGGCAEGMATAPDNSPTASVKPRVTRDGRPVRYGNLPSILPGPEDTYTSYAIPWANASNTPFRMYKHWVHEGGISSPLIAHWPAAIRQKNRLSNEPSHLIDIMATVVDLGEAAYPRERQGVAVTPMEGKSLGPVLRGGRRTPHEAIYWEHEGNQAIRMGQWKLVKPHGAPWELYDLSTDRSELHNLAAQQPDRVRDMAARWQSWAGRANVLPWQSWRKPKA